MYNEGVRPIGNKTSTGMIVIAMILALGLIASTTFAAIQAQQIASLQDQITNLESDLNSLQTQYDDLQDEYEDLFSDYESLKEAFEEPLTNPTIPTIGQVRSWLATDDTDENPYVEGVWTCGDYAAMLMTRAKERNWRLRIAIIFFSFEGASGYGSYTDIYGSYGHAFNVVECTDGIWYIEPQTDGDWYIVSGSTSERTTFDVHTYYDFEDSTHSTIWDGYSFWTNFYTEFT